MHPVQKLSPRRIAPYVATIFHAWTYLANIQCKKLFRGEIFSKPKKDTKLLRSRFSERGNVAFPNKFGVKRKAQYIERGTGREINVIEIQMGEEWGAFKREGGTLCFGAIKIY